MKWIALIPTIQCSAWKPWALAFMWMPQLQQGSPQQDDVPCNNTKSAQEWPEDHEKELKALARPQNSSNPIPIKHLWDVLEQAPRPNPHDWKGPRCWCQTPQEPSEVLSPFWIWEIWRLFWRLELCHIPWAFPEQFLRPGWGRHPAGGATTNRQCSWHDGGLQTLCGGAVPHNSIHMKDPGFPGRTLHCKQIISVIPFTCQWLKCCDWLLYNTTFKVCNLLSNKKKKKDRKTCMTTITLVSHTTVFNVFPKDNIL